MRIHILGIGGTFMSGIALLAKQCGHEVTGSDLPLYPPISTQLMEQNILVHEGYHPEHIEKNLDCVIVGNVIKRGNAAIEYVLNNQIPYFSGPEWLARQVLKHRTVLAVSGTHGKTTTSSLLSWILECANFNPGFLIGGIPENFGVSARLGHNPFFVIEADEYDSAFFDKRSKFLHYHPKIAILNNLEYDHADIFPDLQTIKQQFHYFLRTIPGNGCIVQNKDDANLKEVINMGCWTPKVTFGSGGDWQAHLIEPDGSVFEAIKNGKLVGEVKWNLLGKHNVDNALAALSAASAVNVPPLLAISALASFKNVKRRLEIKGKIKDITIYDDFAHHPTAIATTLAGLRAKIGNKARMIAVVEFGSFTMRSGVHKNHLQQAFEKTDLVACKQTEMDWGLEIILSQLKQPTLLCQNEEVLVKSLVKKLTAGDHVVVMSNTGFGDIHQKLLKALERDE